jgi:CheY-like chemotaxis protein
MDISINRKTVLLVDDNKDAADILSLLLTNFGHCSFAAYNTRERLRLAAETMPDLILHDIQMPIVDGCAAASILRADPKFDRTLIVAVSAYNHRGVSQKVPGGGI